jgi:hypothetical protein
MFGVAGWTGMAPITAEDAEASYNRAIARMANPGGPIEPAPPPLRNLAAERTIKVGGAVAIAIGLILFWPRRRRSDES